MLPGTHVALAFPVVLTTKMPLAMSVAFLVGSVLPDKLDFFLSGGNFQTWSKIHRTWTHTWWLLLACLGALFFVPSHSDMLDLSLDIGKGLFLGMLYHVAADALNPMGIPLLSPIGRKYGLGIIASRGFRATILCSCAWLVTAWLCWRFFIAEEQYVTLASEYLDQLSQAFPQIKVLWGKILSLVT